MTEALISTKGQVVIPQELRDRYHLKPNSKAIWVDLGGVLLLVPRYKNAVKSSRGILSRSHFTQAVLKQERKKERKRK